MAPSSHHPELRGARRLALPALAALSLLAACGPTHAATQAAHSSVSRAASSSTTSSGADSVALPSAGTVTATVPSLGGITSQDDYYGVAADGTAVWIYNGETGMLTRVDATTDAATTKVPLRPGCRGGRGCGNVALSPGAVWVANDADNTVTHVDAATGRVVATLQFPNGAPQVYATPGAIWAANYELDSYSRIDPSSSTVVATLSQHSRPEAVRYVAGAVWLCDSGGDPGLTRLDAHSFAVQAQIRLTAHGASTFCIDAAPLGSLLYVLTDTDAGPLVVDPATGALTNADPVSAQQLVERGITGGATGTWLADATEGLFRLDPHTGRAVGQVRFSGATGVAEDGHSVWVMTSDGTLSKVTPG